MRLIDADEFKRQIAGMAIVNGYSTRKANKMCELIDKQPTAYDVDKVIEYLEELRDRFNKEDFAIRGIIEKAIEKVKAGYVDKQTNK